MKNGPVLFVNKIDCVGCSACVNICPTNSISMIIDNEGFYYPFITFESCIKCYKCLKVCPIKSNSF